MWTYNHTMTAEDELYHYGVKGMKWRKGRKTPIKSAQLLRRQRSISYTPKPISSDKQELVRLKQRARNARSHAATTLNKFKKQNLTKGSAARRINKALDNAISGNKKARRAASNAAAALKAKIARQRKISAAKRRAKARKRKYAGTTQSKSRG